VIEEIYIRDLGVIQEARLPFGAGLTVLTGETGAGKTMVLSALGLLLGERSETSAIRRGQDQAFVEGRWFLESQSQTLQSASEKLSDAGVAIIDGELIMNRSVSSEGRSRASVSGKAVPINVLAELGESLVVVHGQSDQIRLKSANAQREALDQFAGNQGKLDTYQQHYSSWKTLSAKLSDLQQSKEARALEAEQLRETYAELEKADPKPNEDVELAEKANRLTHIEELRMAASAAHESLSSELTDGGADAIGLIGIARRSLENVSAHDQALEQLAETLKQLGYQLNDAAAEISSYLDGLDEDTAKVLEIIQQRRAELTSLMRKYGPSLEEVIAHRDFVSERLLQWDSSADQVGELETMLAEELKATTKSAAALSAARKTAALDLAEQVSAELAALAMPGSSLVVTVEEAAEFGANGKDIISIQLSSFPGAEPRPLGKGASGGELSRIMLAIEVVLAKTQSAPTFIFDEVDAGVGGAAAIEVGRRLAKLAKQAQVIVVTHLAQVASFADQHLRVLKTSDASFTATDVVALDQADRVNELARMLSGLPESESARTHAGELLEKARAEFKTF
jgi:DNA repair protein RecN (Recombination protein N)